MGELFSSDEVIRLPAGDPQVVVGAFQALVVARLVARIPGT